MIGEDERRINSLPEWQRCARAYLVVLCVCPRSMMARGSEDKTKKNISEAG